jgi:CheY-like chemotaxis protein
MSHEIRTPMNAIIGMTAIGGKAPDPERKDYAFSKIEDASKHLLGVINEILDMSKIEANKLELSFEEFSFERMLQKVVNVINFKVEEKHLVFSVDIDHKIPSILVGDDQRLAQVITNLLSNAVKFTPDGGNISLVARLISTFEDVYTVQIEVRDSGIGISAEQQEKLFTSFQQAESGTSRKYGGTGLGLAISKRIVEMMNGHIWVESELDSGSAFIFTIQARSGKDRSLLAPDKIYGNVRVLAVDDAPEIRKYFLSIADQFGFACDVAASGDEALYLIAKNGEYNVYFIDWKMPDMNGVDLSRRINAESKIKPLIVLISATEWDVIQEDASSAGVDKFLPKPLFPSPIADLINEYLGKEAIPKNENKYTEIVSYKGRRILLAEDVEINQEIVRTLLEPTELEIICAADGEEAVRLFSEAPESFDLIFMDVQMPKMDGFEATARIREIEQRRNGAAFWGNDVEGESPDGFVPIVAMTANVFREDVEKCLAVGMNDHVGKPIDIEDILNKIQKYIPQTPPKNES